MSDLFKWDRGAKLFLHDLLGEHHEDTLAGAVAAGDLIHGNATPKWARLAGGSRGQVLRMGASLPGWATDDGWIDMGAQTWTYVSASSFRVSGDQTAIYRPGVFLKWSQTTVRYGVVASSSYSSPNTTVTIIVNADYTVANASISSQCISLAANPQGWPGWFNYTPTYGGFSADPSLVMCRYSISGRTVRFTYSASGDGTSNATTFTISLPVAAYNDGVNGSKWTGMCGYARDNSAALASGARWAISNGGTVINLYPSSTVANWTTSGGKRAYLEGFYEF